MLLIDFSSVLHRLANGSLNNVKHIKTSEPHNLSIGAQVTDKTYKNLGYISHVFDEYNLVLELESNMGVYSIAPNLLNIPNVLDVSKVSSEHKYPFSSYKKSFLNNFFHGTIKNLYEKFNVNNIVFCLDVPTENGYWRKDILPTYKENRKTKKDDSIIDFKSLYKFVNSELFPLIREHTNMTICEYPRAEGDDVIYALAKHFGPSQPIVIITEDKDLVNSIKLGQVTVYRPMMDRYVQSISHEEIEKNIKKHTIMGDSSDNIPNIGHQTEFQPSFIKWLNKKLAPEKEFGVYDIGKVKSTTNFSELTKEYMLENPKFQKYKLSEYMTRKLGTSIGISLIKPEKILEQIKYRNEKYKLSIPELSIEEIKCIQDSFKEILSEEEYDIEETVRDTYFQYELNSMVFKNYSLSGEKTAESFVENFEEKIKENPLWESMYNRNRILIDMDNIPQEMYNGIISSFKIEDTSNSDVIEQFLKEMDILNYQDIMKIICTGYTPQVNWDTWS